MDKCASCGTVNTDSSFCTECGASLTGATVAASSGPSQIQNQSNVGKQTQTPRVAARATQKTSAIAVISLVFAIMALVSSVSRDILIMFIFMLPALILGIIALAKRELRLPLISLGILLVSLILGEYVIPAIF